MIQRAWRLSRLEEAIVRPAHAQLVGGGGARMLGGLDPL